MSLREKIESLAESWEVRAEAPVRFAYHEQHAADSAESDTYGRCAEALREVLASSPAPVVAPAPERVFLALHEVQIAWKERKANRISAAEFERRTGNGLLALAAAPLPVETPTPARSDCAKRDPLVPAAWCHLPEGHAGRCEFVFSTVVGPYRAPGPLPVETDATPDDELVNCDAKREDGTECDLEPHVAGAHRGWGPLGRVEWLDRAPAPLDDGGARMCEACGRFPGKTVRYTALGARDGLGARDTLLCADCLMEDVVDEQEPPPLDDGETGGAP